MLPLDVITNTNTINNPSNLANQLQQLKNAGAAGVMTDVWFGLVERSGPQQYNFSAYVDLAKMVQSAGMKMQTVMSFHQCGGNVGDACNIPLPSWVKGNSADLWYTDEDGNTDLEYISLFADNMSIIQGRTPVQVYKDFMAAFSNSMGDLLGSVITNIQVSMGPAGELRYPSYQLSRWSFCGIGEFQCYSPAAKASFAAAGAAAGHPEWNSPPSNAGGYDATPSSSSFFNSGGYSGAYGLTFLGWYQQQLLDHGDRVLTVAREVFPTSGPVSISAKVSGIHWWYGDQSHAAEVTAGYFNTDGQDSYAKLAQLFAKHSATFDFTCLEMTDDSQPANCESRPQELVLQTQKAAAAAGIPYSGENALPRYDSAAYSTIESRAQQGGVTLEAFTYLRLDDTLMQSNNLATFSNFCSSMSQK